MISLPVSCNLNGTLTQRDVTKYLYNHMGNKLLVHLGTAI
jgi:hypothetical protein